MKRVLVLTYYWPPAGGTSVQRTLKFCKYLPQFGWNPSVLTVKDGNFEYEDQTLFEEVEHVQPVVRARTLEPHSLYRWLKQVGGRLKDNSFTKHRKKDVNSRNFKLAEWCRLNFFIPDSRIGWAPFAIKQGRKVIHEQNPDIIYSSAPPFTVHLVARRLAREFDLPWVADFRDPWLDNLLYDTNTRTSFSRKINKQLEKNCLRDANGVITVGPHLADMLGTKLPQKDRTKIVVIPNGFDMNPSKPKRVSDRFFISYYGIMYERRFPEILFKTLVDIYSSDAEFRNDLLFRFYGTITPGVRSKIESLLPKQNLAIHKPVPQQRFNELLVEEQILTLAIDDVPGNEHIVLGKTFSYLPTGNPILGVGPVDGDAASVLMETGRGRMFDYGDYHGLKAELTRLYSHWRQNESIDTPGKIDRYHRREQAAELAKVLQLTKERRLSP